MKIAMRMACLTVFIPTLYGCASTKMALQDDNQKVTDSDKAIFLMTATIKNEYRTSFQPKLSTVNVLIGDDKVYSGKINFNIDEKAKQETDALPNGNTYLLRMELPAGKYEIMGLTSNVFVFPIFSNYFTPLLSEFTAPEHGVYYLGHINATIKERQGNEFKAGPTTPLIDQAVGGASGGTFEVEISDNSANDETVFRSKFPSLSSATINKFILSPYDRNKAQQWWETH